MHDVDLGRALREIEMSDVDARPLKAETGTAKKKSPARCRLNVWAEYAERAPAG